MMKSEREETEPSNDSRAEGGCLHQACSPSGVEAVVCEDIAKRQKVGINKYGVTVTENPLTLREWLQHAYEECLDQAVYLRRAMDELPPPPTFYNLTDGMKPAHWSGAWVGTAGDELSARLSEKENAEAVATASTGATNT